MATAIEYGLIAALIGVSVVTAVSLVGGGLQPAEPAAPPILVASFQTENYDPAMPHLVWQDGKATLLCDAGVPTPVAGPVGSPPAYRCTAAP